MSVGGRDATVRECYLLKGPPGESLPANYTADDLRGTPGPPGEKGHKVNTAIVMIIIVASTIVFYRTLVYQMQPRNGQNSYKNVATTVAKLPKLEFAHL